MAINSIVNTNLTVFPNVNNSQNIVLCEGDSVVVGSSTYVQEGYFTDTIIAINGCDSILNTTIDISYIDIEIVWSNNQLESNLLNGLVSSYLWSTGETTPTIIPTISGIYWLIATDVNNCNSDTAFYNFTHTNVFEELSNLISIYPNPTSGIINISFYNFKGTLVVLRNVLGEKVSEIVSEQEGAISIQFDMSEYSSGVYFVEFRTNYGIMNYKVVLE